ncbi:PIN domain-like protein [Hyaloscypha variabilis F]|uniref:PIN domain-like protein n=1 Tax=Hyaloscypha variabilis (strain UAMH 11265 / GT02V1 / F) TaxID=1149755 RepID=A0A2J6RL94_HYAVF|nr:PIN domain-like protein [Hyaloscypha variabilis F]
MGPGSLFELLQGDLFEIVDYVFEHHKKTGRGPRLAVNASSWWYSNLTAAGAQSIRDRSGADVNPIERNILFYVLQILPLGIELHFVFDGGKRLSNGGKLYPGHDSPSELFRDTLTKIGVPWHQAPAEAEAECAKMEVEGIVDGVWSEDGDALAFGCKTLIRFQPKVVSSTENGEDVRKSKTQFRIYRLENLENEHPGMDREGFILHAILNGQPKDVGELYSLGPQDVLDAAQLSLGKSLCAAASSRENLQRWATTDLTGYLKGTRRNIQIPPDFPKHEHVQDYTNPVVSTLEVFSNLPQPRDPFDDEEGLFAFLVAKFQWTRTQWIRYVVPAQIVRSLLATDNGQEHLHDFLKLECDLPKKITPKKNQSPHKDHNTRKVKATFLISKATSLSTAELGNTTSSRGHFKTLLWILRKANFNGQRPMTSFLLSPDSARKGKAVSSVLLAEPSATGRTPLTPPSGSASVSPSSSNGEGSSGSTTRPKRSENPPSSPTPMGRKRKRTLPFAMGARVSKNVREGLTQSQEAGGSSSQVNDASKGKRKGKEIEDVSNTRSSRKRARSPSPSQDSSNEDVNNNVDMRSRPAVLPRPSTPPNKITMPADSPRSVIVIDSDSDSDDDAFGSFPSTFGEQLGSTPPIRNAVGASDGFVVISDDGEDEDEEDYGSFPPESQLPAIIGETSGGVFQGGGLNDDSSSDEYGSFPASPDLVALV